MGASVQDSVLNKNIYCTIQKISAARKKPNRNKASVTVLWYPPSVKKEKIFYLTIS